MFVGKNNHKIKPHPKEASILLFYSNGSFLLLINCQARTFCSVKSLGTLSLVKIFIQDTLVMNIKEGTIKNVFLHFTYVNVNDFANSLYKVITK